MVRFNTADDFYETMAEGGNAMRLEDIKGIGPKTANKINNVREIQGTDDIKEMSADELSDKAGISRSRASKAIKGLGGNPGVSKRNRSTGTVSAAGIQQAQGDFMVGFSELDKARARNDAVSRSETAVRVDERRRAPVTTDYEQWKNAPGEWDFPGVDTPTQEPNLLPKDVKAGDPQTADFDAVDERRQERQAQSYPRKKDSASGKEDYILETGEDRIPASEMAASGMGVSDADTFTSALDVPASPEEVFEGVGLGSPSAPGGQAYNALEGGPVETDKTDQEQKPPEQALEKQQQGGNTQLYEFPPWTLSRLMTLLNDKVYGDNTQDREKYSQMRQKVRRAQRGMGRGVPFTKGEYNTAKRLLKDAKEEANERAERMEANIFGDTDEQADIADRAFQGIMNNPPSFD